MLTRRQIPNLLTAGRVLAVPLCLLLILLAPQAHGALFLVFLAASATDFLDGYLARRWNAVSPLGALLDPIADKLLAALLLLYLAVYYRLALLPVAAMILRELYISGLREFLAARQVALPVSKGGKLKTSLQLSGILLMLLGLWVDMDSACRLGTLVLWLAAAVSVASAIQYSKASLPHLR